MDFCVKTTITSPNQMGFISGHRTANAHIITHTLTQKHRNNSKLYSCFIDFSKAFAAIPRDTLVNKLLGDDIMGD